MSAASPAQHSRFAERQCRAPALARLRARLRDDPAPSRRKSVDFNIPNIQVGEIIAILDSGMYSEAKGNNFNSLPRPASALVRGNVSYLIRKRETINDLFSSMKVPVHLRKNIK